VAKEPTGQAEVLCERHDDVLVITLNRPERRNAVNGAVSAGIAQALDLLDASSELRAAVLHGAGSTFCSGMDLTALAAGENARVGGRGFAGIVERPPSKPIVAAVEGWALGGGFEIALACDLVVAARGARFGLPEVRRGLAARGGGIVRLAARLPPAIALELILTGDPMDADRARSCGLVNCVVDDGEALDAALALATTIAANAPLAVRTSKALAQESAGWPPAEAFARQAEFLAPVFASADAAEGIAAFHERRDPVWSGT
jgi:enoyl-CoA hydratase